MKTVERLRGTTGANLEQLEDRKQTGNVENTNVYTQSWRRLVSGHRRKVTDERTVKY